MQRTNLSIKREILRKCRAQKISFTYDRFTGCVSVLSIPIDVHAGYVYASYIGYGGQRICHQVEYVSFERWYNKFDIFTARYTAVFRPKKLLKSAYNETENRFHPDTDKPTRFIYRKTN